MFAGLLFGALLGTLLLVRASLERNRVAALAAALLLIASAAGAIIASSWQGPVEAIERVELALTLTAGPVTLVLICWQLRRRVPMGLTVGLPLAAFAGLVLIEARYGGDPVVEAVPIHAGFTLWGWWLFVASSWARTEAEGIRSRRQRRLAFWLLIAASIANAASLIRLAFPDVAALRPIVPWTLSILFMALLLSILWAHFARPMPILNQIPTGDSDETRLARRAVELVERERLFRNPDLKPAEVGAQLQVSADELGRSLSLSEWGSFAAMLREVRLDQARKMLSDPAEQATSIDAVGLLCGFRSRSALYESFHQRFGMSPGAWRNKALNLSGT